jgi:two-component system, chemotaxis family, protein-glutamate methylesterase/glutaminase
MNPWADRRFEAIVIGASAGGLSALSRLLEKLSPDFPLPIIVAQHRTKDKKNLLEEILQSRCKIKIKQADEKERIEKGTVYIAPPDYHLLIEGDQTFSLSSEGLVLYSRPSIDVLFESAAAAYRDALVGIILTGASSDGAYGLQTIKKNGGLTVAQSPGEAEFPHMPRAAIDNGGVILVLTLEEIQEGILDLYQ